MECRNFVQAVVSKLQDKTPLIYTVSRKLSCFDPKTASEGCDRVFRVLVRLVHEVNSVAEA